MYCRKHAISGIDRDRSDHSGLVSALTKNRRKQICRRCLPFRSRDSNHTKLCRRIIKKSCRKLCERVSGIRRNHNGDLPPVYDLRDPHTKLFRVQKRIIVQRNHILRRNHNCCRPGLQRSLQIVMPVVMQPF